MRETANATIMVANLDASLKFYTETMGFKPGCARAMHSQR